jgi:hypothetical protein
MGKFVDITGQRFGRLVVKGDVGKRGNYGEILWECLCDCGILTFVRGYHLKKGRISSCGCYHDECTLKRNTTHGKRHSLIYGVWLTMKSRCFNSKMTGYHNYGGRGITVCDRWANSFENFYADMGDPPEKNMSIDRIDNDGNYEPGNCRWATLEEQGRNKRTTRFLTFEGKTQTIKEWAAEKRIVLGTINSRLARGHSVEEALSVGFLGKGIPRKIPTLIINDEAFSIKEWLKRTCTSKTTYYRRLKKGLTPEQALFPLKNISAL